MLFGVSIDMQRRPVGIDTANITKDVSCSLKERDKK